MMKTAVLFLALLVPVLGSTPAFKTNYDVLPQWVQGRNSSMFRREHERNVQAVERINSLGVQADVLLLGDSITAWNKPVDLSKLPGSRHVWEDNFGDLVAEPLGIPGSRIADVIWRIAVGKEKPELDPKMIILFIGINDIVHKTPNIAERMDFLLGWITKHSPNSKIVVQLLLPSLSPAVEVNMEYVLLSIKHNATVSYCMQDVRRGNKKYFVDILHPSIEGQDRLQRCLRDLFESSVEGLVKL